jgi:glycosyltransferase involved in cell wall biosynthesis
MNKILFIIPQLKYGGAERVFVTLANEFNLNKKTEVLIFVNGTSNESNFILNKNVKVFSSDYTNFFFKLFELVKLINFEKPKVVISALDNGNLFSLLSSFFVHKKIDFHITIHSNLSQVNKIENAKKGKLARYLLTFLYHRAKSIITVSNGVNQDFRNFFKNNGVTVKTIYNPIVNKDLIRLSNEKINSNFIPKLNDVKIVSVGRFVEAKNFELLIESFAILRSKIECTLLLIGDGPLLHKYELLIEKYFLKNDIIFLGFLSNPYNFIKASDLFVLSSSYEGLPTVLIEAMACGTKVVSTDCPSGPREILEDGLWGKLVPVGDKQALADAMYDSIMDKHAPNVKKRANDFSVEIAAKKYLEHFGLSN